jgi:thiamine transport system permease protein
MDRKLGFSGSALKGNSVGRWVKTRLPSSGGLVWLPPVAFLLAFFLLPILSVFRLAAEQAVVGVITAADWVRVGRALGFTFWQAGLSTILTLLLGLPAAWIFTTFRFPGKSILRTLSSLPFILPTVVVAAGFNALIGPRGWLNLGLMHVFSLAEPPLELMNTLGAILLAHVFYNTSIIIRLVGAAWSQLDPRLEQAARVLGASPWETFRKVTFPLLRPTLLAATLLVFLFDFSSFGVILLLGGARFATLEVEIYIQALHMLNLPLAGLLSVIQLLCTLAMMEVYLRLAKGTDIPLLPRLGGEGNRSPRSLREWALVGSILTVLGVFMAAPVGALVFRSFVRLDPDRGQREGFQRGFTLDYYTEIFQNRQQSMFYVPPGDAAMNSLVYAAATAAIALPIGLLAVYALKRRGRLSRWLDGLIMLPLGTSAVTLGLGFVVTFTGFTTSPLLLPLAHSLVALPIVVRTLLPAAVSIPPSLRQAAAVLGAAPLRVWANVDLPIISRAMMVGAVFTFTVSLGEFGATTFLARPDRPTLPVAIYRYLSQPGGMNYGQALAMATILMALCAICLLIIDHLQERN